MKKAFTCRRLLLLLLTAILLWQILWSIHHECRLSRQHGTATAVEQLELSNLQRQQTLPLAKEETNTLSFYGIQSLEKMTSPSIDGFCSLLLLSQEQPIHIQFTFGSDDLFRNSGGGTGNWILAFYSMRLAALAHGQVDLTLTCTDALEQQSNLILPWLTGHFPAQQQQQEKYSNLADVCGKNMTEIPLTYMVPFIQHELDRMVQALVADSSSGKVPAREGGDALSGIIYQLSQPNAPLLPNIELDEAVIHFRCGDLLVRGHPGYAFYKFHALARHFPPTTRTIGIVTQPFHDKGQNRRKDAGLVRRKRCRKLVRSLRDYLQQHFPKARIRIRNEPNETIAVAYARMILARHFVGSVSTFSTFAAVASKGKAYIPRPKIGSRAPNQWIYYPKPLDLDNLFLIQEPDELPSIRLTKLWDIPNGEEKILNWFRSIDTTLNESSTEQE